MNDDPTDEVTDLIQHLIRNACVNDGTQTSGHESRSVATLQGYLGEGRSGATFDHATYEAVAGRGSLITRIEGSDPDAPTMMLMGHTDVVPANADRWQRDPHGGELVDGTVWGRGAIDMLNLTSSMAVAFRRLAASNWTPRGTLIYLAVADEEAGGRFGAQWLHDNHPDAVTADYVLTEYGGARIDLGGGPKLPVCVTEKGPFWSKLTFRGTPGHGSMPWRSDNALAKAAEAVGRLQAFRPPAEIHEVWRRFVEGLAIPGAAGERWLDGPALDALLDDPEVPTGLAAFTHACTHTTFAPTMMDAGVKNNVIPDTAVLTVDVRVLPGQTEGDVEALFRTALGDLFEEAELQFEFHQPASGSPIDTPLWDALQRAAEKVVPGAQNIPMMVTGATDSRFLRDLGAVSYGYGAYADNVELTGYRKMFHGDDERIDQVSLRRSVDLWELVAHDVLD